jgi:hypothetical protein
MSIIFKSYCKRPGGMVYRYHLRQFTNASVARVVLVHTARTGGGSFED